MILILLASGRGSRLRNKTKEFPKCMTKIGKKMIIDYLTENFEKFNKVIVVTGYKSQKIINYLKIKKKIKNIIFVKNSKYLNTNMIESLFKTEKLIDEDVIVSYSDIVFDKNIINRLIKEKRTCLPLYSKWLKLWRWRMKTLTQIKNDAEDIKIKNKKIYAIGGKIQNKLPKLQFMGLIKILKKDFFNMARLYKKLNNKNIDMTNFLNQYIKNQNNLFYFKTARYWFEIDNIKDSKVAEIQLRNYF